MRHAKSSHSDAGIDDFDRPLNQRGIKAASHAGSTLLTLKLVPDCIICSPSTRTRETARLLCEKSHFPQDSIIYEQSIYEADLNDLLEIIGSVSSDFQRPMIIGHNPSLDLLLIHLCGNRLPRTGKGKLMTTAAIARISMPDNWHDLPRACAKLVSLIRPG